MASFSSAAFSTNAFSILAFDFDSTPPSPSPAPAGGHFLPHHHDGKYRKTPPGNLRFVYDKINESNESTEALLEAIEPYVDVEDFEQAASAGKLPPIYQIDYAALAANQLAYDQFVKTLNDLHEKIALAQKKLAAEDDELLLMAVFACSIN